MGEITRMTNQTSMAEPIAARYLIRMFGSLEHFDTAVDVFAEYAAEFEDQSEALDRLDMKEVAALLARSIRRFQNDKNACPTIPDNGSSEKTI